MLVKCAICYYKCELVSENLYSGSHPKLANQKRSQRDSSEETKSLEAVRGTERHLRYLGIATCEEGNDSSDDDSHFVMHHVLLSSYSFPFFTMHLKTQCFWQLDIF